MLIGATSRMVGNVRMVQFGLFDVTGRCVKRLTTKQYKRLTGLESV